MTRSPSDRLADLGVALENSLDALEGLTARGRGRRLRLVVARRRRAMIVFRRATGQRKLNLGRPAPDWSVIGLITAEWELAHLLLGVGSDLAPDDPLKEILASIQTEVEETALTLRLIEQTGDDE